MPRPKWLIEGLFEVNSLVMVAGPSNNYKSFLAIDWGLALASGRKWNNRPTTPSRVLYVLGEGKSNLLKRLEAWMHYHQVSPEERALIKDRFRVTFDVPQLALGQQVDSLLANLEVEQFSPNVIVIDTFARSFVGMDENDAKDTGMWIAQADRLRQLGYTVIFLHHTAKNTEFGLKYRGSTAIMGAMDTAFTLAKDSENKKLSKLECTKQKDHDEGDPMWFQRVSVKPDPKDEGSIVLIPSLRIDDRLTPEYQAKQNEINVEIDKLICDNTYQSDWARGRELAKQFPPMTDSAGQQRISARRQKIRESSQGPTT
jgi:hypothetical protein